MPTDKDAFHIGTFRHRVFLAQMIAVEHENATTDVCGSCGIKLDKLNLFVEMN